MTSRPHGIDGWGYPNQEYAPEPRVMTEAPGSALVVTPHPDDAEGGCGATMAKWIAESGTKVVILMCTNGNKGTGDRSFTPEALAATREIEQQNAANVLGVSEVVFLRYGDGELEDTHAYRGQVVREIRRHKPEVVFGIDPYRVTSHTHRDHRHSGQAALDAAFSYAWSWQDFPEQIREEGLEPHRVREALLWGSERPGHFHLHHRGTHPPKSRSSQQARFPNQRPHPLPAPGPHDRRLPPTGRTVRSALRRRVPAR